MELTEEQSAPHTESTERVLVALSGGIDSAATALLLMERGYAVTGLYIDMTGSEESLQRARQVAQLLNVELIVENATQQFQKEIVEYTISEHRAGRTPSPCVRCNPRVKWAIAIEVADRLGINRVATGHYVRITPEGHLLKGIDPAKDQSYYLWELPQSTLDRAIAPLGELTKQQVRHYIAENPRFAHLTTSRESMSLCFLQGESYSEFISRELTIEPGAVVDADTHQTIGAHDGYQLYTIGQKRGFTGGGTILALAPTTNSILTTTHPEKLYTDTIRLHDWHLKSPTPLEDMSIRIRGLGRNPQCGIKSMEHNTADNTLIITLVNAEAWAVAAGQPVVIQQGERIIGGGWINL